MKKLPNILFLSIDDLRYDCISAAGDRPYLEKYDCGRKVATPNIDELAAGGSYFRQAITASTHTPPSHASIFTGLYPPRSGIRPFFKTRLFETVRTAAELFSSAGYTCVHAASFPYFKFLGLERGVHRSFPTGDETLYTYLKDAGKPVYLFVHFFDVHDPYLYSPLQNFEDNRDYREQFLTLAKQYNISTDGEPFPYVRSFQKLIRELYTRGDLSTIYSLYIEGVNKFDGTTFRDVTDRLKTLLPEENTLTLLFSDHGEGPGKDTFGHGIELREEMIRVPLIIKWRGNIPSGRTIDCQVRTVDILPTVIDILNQHGAGIEMEYAPDGQSLLPLLYESGAKHRPAYSEVWHHTLSGDEMKEFMDRCLERNEMLSPQYTTYLYQRSLRNPPWKIILEGGELPDALSPFDAPDREFITHSIISLLHRRPDDREIERYLGILKSARGGRGTMRDELTREREFTAKNFLQHTGDIEEKNCLALTPHSDSLQVFLHMMEEADRIARSGPGYAPSVINYSTGEEQKLIEDRLRSLGYL